MGMGETKCRQESFWVATEELPRTKRGVFYERVNRILEEKRIRPVRGRSVPKVLRPGDGVRIAPARPLSGG